MKLKSGEYCSSSGGTALYIQQSVYIVLKIMELFKITYVYIWNFTDNKIFCAF